MTFGFEIQICRHFFCVENLFVTIAHDRFVFDVGATLVLALRTVLYLDYLSELLRNMLSYLYIYLSHQCWLPHFKTIIELLLHLCLQRIELIDKVQSLVKVQCACAL